MPKLLTRFSTYTLAVALVISAISAYYSIVGLTAIFAAAVTPIIIMGAALELGKLTAAVWLKLNWHRASIVYKFYLVPAVAFLMMLTSMGIFCFLSKAHSDQGLVTGDSQAKISIYDEKIKIQRDNIGANKAALAQMDTQVNDIMSKGDSERSVERSVQIRRQQAPERAKLLKEIEASQKTIQALNEERAPLAAENRKIEAEVGPIKYIAALIYGDNPDANLLESAVRWVIILIVAVFDPLALVLILAAQQSMRWEREEEEEEKDDQETRDWFDQAREQARQLDLEAAEQATAVTEPVAEHLDDTTSPDDTPDVEQEVVQEAETPQEDTRTYDEKFPYLTNAFVHFSGLQPMVAKSADEVTWVKVPQVETTVEETAIEPAPMPEPTADSMEALERPGDYITAPSVSTTFEEIDTVGVTIEKPWFSSDSGYVSYEGKSTSIEALRGIRPDLIYPAGTLPKTSFNFGSNFPEASHVGDQYMRTDIRPNKLFKFNGQEWMHVDKTQNTGYLSDAKYIQWLIDKLNTNEYHPTMLTEDEEEEITAFLNK
jgi:hypothetical protein